VKPRTVAICGAFARISGICFGIAFFAVGIGEAINGYLCCRFSEGND